MWLLLCSISGATGAHVGRYGTITYSEHPAHNLTVVLEDSLRILDEFPDNGGS